MDPLVAEAVELWRTVERPGDLRLVGGLGGASPPSEMAALTAFLGDLEKEGL